MRLVFAGTPQTAVPALDAVLASRHEVAAVLTRPDAPAGRGRHVESSPVARRAAGAGLEVLSPVRPRDPLFLERLRQIAPDCVPMVAYGALIPQAALDVPAHGWVNLHFSVLPAWRCLPRPGPGNRSSSTGCGRSPRTASRWSPTAR